MTTEQLTEQSARQVQRLDRVVIRFAGDSGGGMLAIVAVRTTTMTPMARPSK